MKVEIKDTATIFGDTASENTVIKVDDVELTNVTEYQIKRSADEPGSIELTVTMKLKHDSLFISSKS